MFGASNSRMYMSFFSYCESCLTKTPVHLLILLRKYFKNCFNYAILKALMKAVLVLPVFHGTASTISPQSEAHDKHSTQ